MNTTDVKAFFDRVASDCDTMRIANYDQRVIDRLGAFADLTPDMVVADVGTGTGCVAAGIAPRVARVIGIDISPSTPRSLPPPVCPRPAAGRPDAHVGALGPRASRSRSLTS